MKEKVFFVVIPQTSILADRLKNKVLDVNRRSDNTYYFQFTRSKTEALRVVEKDIPEFKALMQLMGIDQSIIDDPNTFVSSSYCQDGTRWNPLSI